VNPLSPVAATSLLTAARCAVTSGRGTSHDCTCLPVAVDRCQNRCQHISQECQVRKTTDDDFRGFSLEAGDGTRTHDFQLGKLNRPFFCRFRASSACLAQAVYLCGFAELVRWADGNGPKRVCDCFLSSALAAFQPAPAPPGDVYVLWGKAPGKPVRADGTGGRINTLARLAVAWGSASRRKTKRDLTSRRSPAAGSRSVGRPTPATRPS
jgi:hypothetical protein